MRDDLCSLLRASQGKETLHGMPLSRRQQARTLQEMRNKGLCRQPPSRFLL
jgi:hypothetical protein